MGKSKYYIIPIILGVLLVMISISLMVIDNKYSKVEHVLDNVFFYLPNDNYKDMNEISDLCKIALVYDTKYAKSDYKIVDNNGKKINGFTKSNIQKSVKNVLGKSASINFNKEDDGDYSFIDSNDDCYFNYNVSNLTFDSKNDVLYTIDDETVNKRYVISKWDVKSSDGDNVFLHARALMIMNNDNKYNVYVDNKMEKLIGSYKTLDKAKEAANNNIMSSYDYNFKLIKSNGNYIWKEFSRDKNEEVIYD